MIYLEQKNTAKAVEYMERYLDLGGTKNREQVASVGPPSQALDRDLQVLLEPHRVHDVPAVEADQVANWSSSLTSLKVFKILSRWASVWVAI